MPSRCCVTMCNGNYDNGPKVSIFKFPTDETLFQKWIQAIPRKFTPTKSSRVCELHFLPEDIQKTTEIFDEKNGKKICAPLAYPRLKAGAVPQVFEGCPAYLSSNKVSRKSMDEKKIQKEFAAVEKAIAESLTESEEYAAKVTFTSLADLLEKIDFIGLSEDFSIIKRPDKVIFALMDTETIPFIKASVVINDNLSLIVNIGKQNVRKLNTILPDKINNLNELGEILKVLNLYVKPCTELDNYDTLIEMVKNLKVPDGMESVLLFVSNQLELLKCKAQTRKYKPDFLVWASLVFSISPHVYRFLLSSKMFILPHPSTLRRMTSKFDLNPKNEQNDVGFLSYIKSKYNLLNQNDMTVILQIDEIHLKPLFDYKGGAIFGTSYDSINAATRAYTFLISSLLSSYKDVAHILPVKNIDAEFLFDFIKRVVIGLENIGFMVICVVSDNNSINGKAMSLFASPPQLSIVYRHPANPLRPLFYAFDSVHILKCIRNNWLNQKSHGQSLFFPQFDDPESSKLLTASFLTLKKMFEVEFSENLVKYSYGLTLKALHPTNLERQNVSLVLKIFNQYISEGLKELGEKHNLIDYSSTAKFIEIITRWFDIVNVKTPNKGKRLRNPYQEPLTYSEDDCRFQFLNEFLNWLDHWKLKKCDTGALTRETHLALTHTTYCLLELCNYCVNELNFKYILLGKIQTDMLESRFGQYRQLSGSNYNISITQVFESEAKLRLRDFLPLTLNSSTFGDLSIKSFCEKEVIETEYKDETEKFRSITVSEKDLNFPDYLPILTYLAGYCVYKLLKKNTCKSCSGTLTVNKMLDLDTSYRYIRNLDRGGLLCPHQDVVLAVCVNYCVVKKLLSKEFEHLFLKVKNQRNLVASLTLNILIAGEMISFDMCEEGHSVESILKYILRASTNTFLNNYCSSKNQQKTGKGKKRKLQTFNKENIIFSEQVDEIVQNLAK